MLDGRHLFPFQRDGAANCVSEDPYLTAELDSGHLAIGFLVKLTSPTIIRMNASHIFYDPPTRSPKSQCRKWY
jgi:hypothetical protein